MFTQQHYIALAAALKQAREDTYAAADSTSAMWGIGRAQAYITDVLAADNPKFDGEKFAQASGMRG